MLRYDRRNQAFAACLSALAGYVDALGYLALGGFFVSFMSGNSTRLAVGAAVGSRDAGIAGALVATFVLGATAGAILARFAGKYHRPAVLAFVAFLLAIAAGLDAAGVHGLPMIIMALAMGSENAAYTRDGEVSVGVTYMTGTLVKLGQVFAAVILGEKPKFAWAPYLLLWIGLVLGAIMGAVVFSNVRLQGLWGASAAAAVFSIAATKIGTGERIWAGDDRLA